MDGGCEGVWKEETRGLMDDSNLESFWKTAETERILYK